MENKEKQCPGQGLDDRQLAQATGGTGSSPRPIAEIVCPKCGHRNIIYPASPDYCANCNEQIIFG